MAKVVRSYTRDVTAFFNKISSLGCPFITVTGTTKIEIGNDCIVDFNNGYFRIRYNNSTLAESTLLFGALTSTLCASNTFFYGQYYDSANRRQIIVYELINNKSYCGALGSGGPDTSMSYKKIDETTMRDSDGNVYKHGVRLGFKISDSELKYDTKDCLFPVTSSLTKVLDDPNLIRCTEIPTDKLLTFNNKEYYSLSNHILILKDGLL